MKLSQELLIAATGFSLYGENSSVYATASSPLMAQLHLYHKLAKDQSHCHGIHIPCTPLWQWIPTASIINVIDKLHLSAVMDIHEVVN